MPAHLFDCECCGKRFRLTKRNFHETRVGGGRFKREHVYRTETLEEARARHEASAVCQAASVERFAEDCGWERIGAGSHSRVLQSAGFKVVRLPCNVDTEASVNAYTTFAHTNVVAAVRALTGVRLRPTDRERALNIIVYSGKLNAVLAARRMGGAGAVLALARSLLKEHS